MRLRWYDVRVRSCAVGVCATVAAPILLNLIEFASKAMKTLVKLVIALPVVGAVGFAGY